MKNIFKSLMVCSMLCGGFLEAGYGVNETPVLNTPKTLSSGSFNDESFELDTSEELYKNELPSLDVEYDSSDFERSLEESLQSSSNSESIINALNLKRLPCLIGEYYDSDTSGDVFRDVRYAEYKQDLVHELLRLAEKFTNEEVRKIGAEMFEKVYRYLYVDRKILDKNCWLRDMNEDEENMFNEQVKDIASVKDRDCQAVIVAFVDVWVTKTLDDKAKGREKVDEEKRREIVKNMQNYASMLRKKMQFSSSK